MKNQMVMTVSALVIAIVLGLVAMVMMFSTANDLVPDAEATEDITLSSDIVLMITGTHPDGLDLVWTDASDNWVGYGLISDATGLAVESFEAGLTAGTVRGLTCGTAHRLWLVSEDRRTSNTVVGTTGPCE